MQAFPEPLPEIFLPMLAGKPSPYTNPRHRQAVYQNVVGKRRSINAQGTIDPRKTLRRLLLSFRDGLWRHPAVDRFLARINRSRSPFGRFKIPLESPAALVLCIIDVLAGVKVRQRIVPCRAHHANLGPRFVWIINVEGRELGIFQLIRCTSIMDF